MNRRRFLTILTVVFLFGVTIGFAYLLSVRGTEGKEENLVLIARQLHDSIEARAEAAVDTARTMSGDPYVRMLLEESGSGEKVKEYLKSLSANTRMDSLFLVASGTGRLYSKDGFLRRMSSADSWYQGFLDSQVPYAVFTAPDSDGEDGWSAFAVARVSSSEGDTLGICGASVEMADLAEALLSFGKTYEVTGQLVNAEGQVQVDEKGCYLSGISQGGSILSDEKEEYVYVRKKDDGYLVTEYVNLLDWYLLVEGSDKYLLRGKDDFLLFVIAEAVFFAGGLVVLLFASRGENRERKGKYTLQTDPLTGLLNRNYFKAVYGERGIFNTARYKAIAVFDIDFFKEANDTIDGDAVLRRVADLARETAGERGEIFRWGGDEFMMLMEWSVSFSYELCREFCKKVEDDGKVTISVGVTEIRLSDSIKKNYYRAAQGCYLVKEMGGNGVKRC